MRNRLWLAIQHFLRVNFGHDPVDDRILALQIKPHMKLFTATVLGWNLVISTLSMVEHYLLGDRRLLWVAAACWVLGATAIYEKYRMEHSAHAPSPQQQANFFTRWMMIAAISWMVMCLLIIPHENPMALLFYSYCLGFVVAVHAASSSSYMPGYMWFITPPLLFQSLSCALYANSVAYVLGALTSPGILVFLWFLGRSFNQIQRISFLLQHENQELIASLTDQTEHAHAARSAAENANAVKSKFLASASHDLRQPIHAQGLFLNVLARTQLDAQQRQLLDSVCAAGSASCEMLNTLLDFSRIEAGIVEPQLSTFRMQSVLNKIEGEFAQQADEKGMRYRSRESALVVQSDPILIEMIMRNLVANAIRYTDCGGLLVVCRKRGNHAVLEVWDTGIGIAPEHQKDVFREFHQVSNPQRDRRNGLGLGLGLAIVHSLALTLGHSLTLASTLNKGSVFRLTLPLATQAPTPEALTAGGSQMQALRLRVLVIEDDEFVRRAMLTLLRDWGCECVGASDVEEALEQASNLRPQVIVSDYRLREGRTGVQAIAAVRQTMGEDLPALLITGDTAPDRLREAMASGVALFHKPVWPSQLYQGLARVQRLAAGSLSGVDHNAGEKQ